MARISRTKLALAKSLGAASRISGRGGGTSLPGKVLLRLQPDAVGRLAGELPLGSVVISATNGKTTTASILAAILRTDGRSFVHNSAGANMAGGIATALLDQTSGGKTHGDLGLFEVDEAWVSWVAEEVAPKVIVLGNLFRDQLDRYGELETLADSWQDTVAGLGDATRVVVNADDPLLATIGQARANTIFFGVEDTTLAETAPRHAADSKFCRRCGSELRYTAVQLGHLGHYRCPNCDFARPQPAVSATRIEPHGMDGSTVEISTPNGKFEVLLGIPGLYNVYNAVAAAAAAHALGISDETIADGLRAARAVFGRVERLQLDGLSVSLLLIKNPTGANEVLRTITQHDGEFDLWIALNDGIADGRDISWVWDADFELLAGRLRRVTCSGTRADELALRLAYAGIDRDRIAVDDGIERSFDRAVGGAREGGATLFALPTYTALLDLRTAVAKRGDAPDYWSDK